MVKKFTSSGKMRQASLSKQIWTFICTYLCYIYSPLRIGLRDNESLNSTLQWSHDMQYQLRNEICTDNTVCNYSNTPGGMGVLCVNQTSIDDRFLRPRWKVLFLASLGWCR